VQVTSTTSTTSRPFSARVAPPKSEVDSFVSSGAIEPEFNLAKFLNKTQQVPEQPPAPPTHPRPMTADEKADFGSWFPKLDVETSQVTAEATRTYNCISWTTGNTKSWDWPPYMYSQLDPREAFVQYYTDRGFRPISAEEAASVGKDKELVAYWEDPNGPTHGSVSGPTHLDRWESKCGQAARITHERDELESEVYGKIMGYWLKQEEVPVPPPQELDPGQQQQLDTKLALKVIGLESGLVKQFGQAYRQWESERSRVESSNPADYLKGAGYQKILALGPEVTPLLVQKMRAGDFFSQYAAQELSAQDARRSPLRVDGQGKSEQDKSIELQRQYLTSNW
jgi:hypothetical protein